MNKKTSQTQWDYPEEEDEEEADETGHTDRQHSMSSSPQRDVDEDASQTSDMGHLNGEEASSSTTDTETRPKTKESQKLEKFQKSKVDSQDGDKHLVGNSDSMDIEEQVEDSSEVSQCVEGDSVSSTIQPSSEAGVPDTTSILSVMDEIFQGKSKHGKSAPVSQSYDYTNSTAAASVMQGEPPPPGTDLDLLLAAPPPPPPPADEDSTGPMEAYDTSVPMAMTSHPLTYSGIDGDPMVHSSVSDTSMYPSETGIMSTESSYVSERTDAPPLVTQEPVVIARPPQVFTRGDEPGSSAEVMSGTEAMPESGPGEDISPSPTVAALSVAAELPSSSGITSEKKKKKKDKSISGSGLHLKKKNVTSLVQKWQKVKMEVEIEERNREEREQAIRQKLEEYKQEYS